MFTDCYLAACPLTVIYWSLKTATAFAFWLCLQSSAVHHMHIKARLLNTYIILYNLADFIRCRCILQLRIIIEHIWFFMDKVCGVASPCRRQMAKGACIIDLHIKCNTCWDCRWMGPSGGRGKQWPSVLSFTPSCPPYRSQITLL